MVVSFIGEESEERGNFAFGALDNLCAIPVKRLLITGCNGLLGSELIERFSKRFIISGLDIKPHLGKREKCQFVEQDLTDIEGLKSSFLEFDPDFVINAAALTDVDRCERDRKKAWDVNVRGVENIASLCSKLGCKVIHISTDYIFNGIRGPYSEGDLPSPCNFYGETKWEGEKVLERFPLDYAIVRTSALYGLCKRGERKFFDLLLDRLSRGEGVHGFVDQFTTPTYVGDLVEGIKMVMDRGKGGIFHISGGEFLSRFDFARKVAVAFGYDPSLIKPEESTKAGLIAPRPLKGGLKIDKAQKVLAYSPHSVVEALETIKTEREKDVPKK